MTEICTLTTEKDINFKDLFKEKIGYSREVFYFGTTDSGKSLYSVSKTAAVVGGSTICLIGDSEDIKKAQKRLENKLQIRLTEFVKNPRYKR